MLIKNLLFMNSFLFASAVLTNRKVYAQSQWALMGPLPFLMSYYLLGTVQKLCRLKIAIFDPLPLS